MTAASAMAAGQSDSSAAATLEGVANQAVDEAGDDAGVAADDADIAARARFGASCAPSIDSVLRVTRSPQVRSKASRS